MVEGFTKNGKFRPTGKKDRFGMTFIEFSRGEERRRNREHEERERIRKEKGIKRERTFVVKPNEKTIEKNKILQGLKDKGFKLTKEISRDEDDPEDEGKEFTTIEITEKQTLDGINGKRTALEITDFITGTTEEQRFNFDIDTDNKLSELQDAGKIKFEDGVWEKVN
jgi:hypothetical protein